MKQIKVLFLFLSLFLFFSCKNFITSPNNSISLYLSGDIVKRNIEDNKELTVDAVLYKEDKEYETQSKTLSSLDGVTFSFNSLPLASYSISLSIKKDNITLFSGLSDTVKIDDGETDKTVSIELNRNKALLSFDTNGGDFTSSAPSFYYPSFTTKLPIPIRNDDTFLGWYLTPSCTENEIKTIGLHGDVTGDVTLYAKWLDKNPSPVTELEATSNLNEITLTWINPNINDFNKVDISYTVEGSTDVHKVSNTSSKGEKASQTVTNLTTGKKHNFTLKVIDNGGNVSEEKTISSYPMHPLTTSVTPLPNYKDSGTYVAFGDYPQTVLDTSKPTGITFSSERLQMGQYEYLCGSDGYYYYDAAAQLEEKNGVLYFDNKQKIQGEKTYFFRVEPIVWQVLTEDYVDANGEHKGKLLLSEKILEHCAFYSKSAYNDRKRDGIVINDNDYKESKIRAFLHGIMHLTHEGKTVEFIDKGFMQTAFTSKAQNNLVTVTLDNSLSSLVAPSTQAPTDVKVCENTQDNIFLLSHKELTTVAYGLNDKTRITTDFSRATREISEIDPTSNKAPWGLRSPCANKAEDQYSSHIQCVNASGAVVTDGAQGSKGVVPAIVVK